MNHEAHSRWVDHMQDVVWGTFGERVDHATPLQVLAELLLLGFRRGLESKRADV